MNKFSHAILASCLSLSSAQAAVSYRGPSNQALEPHLRPRSLSYMTAEQMAERVQNLSGFYQSGFATYARIIGTFDPVIGARTNDRPTALSVLIINDLLKEVAENVVAREIFLDEADRVVFIGIDLAKQPDRVVLTALMERLCAEWLDQECPAAFNALLLEDFAAHSSENLTLAWQDFISLFLQNGTLYYL